MRKGIIAVGLALTLLVGCAVGNKVKEVMLANDLLVKAVFAEVIHKNPSWKPEANKIANALLAAPQGSKLEYYQDKAIAEIYAKDMSIETKLLAEQVVIAVGAGLKEEFKRREISSELLQSEKVRSFIEWVELVTRA